MLEYDFHNSLGYWLITTAHLYERAINEQLAPEGISYRQCQTLAYLAIDGPMAQNELAARMQIEPPTLVGVLDRMERDRLIQRKPCKNDRRRKVIHPAAAAKPVWKKIVACALNVRDQAASGLTKKEQAQLKALLKKIQHNLQQPSELKDAS